MATYLTKPLKLQLEISSMCNALCYGCARTESANFNTKRPLIPDKKILELDVISRILTQFRTVTTLDFCGTVDDPFMHPNFNDVLELALAHGVENIFIHTNGSIRDSNYWQQTSRILQCFKNHELKFSIDGLEDTNHLYRQRTNFQRIMKNATAFIDSGGNASWQMLVFPWNKHQIELARLLSREMGFTQFIHRKDRSVVADRNWTIEDIQRIQQNNRKPKQQEFNIDVFFNDNAEYENNPIECFFQQEQMYFIDFNARLWPCCFLRNTEFFGVNKDWHQVRAVMYDAYNDDKWNRLDLYTVEQILDHPYYQQDLTASFNDKYGSTCGNKLVKCAKTCSIKGQTHRPIAKHKIEEHV